ncbi:MAG: imidazole glycerol phosphate synthase subunit HisH [Syntrophomonadaceae bacterium]|jgi:glutamine amidotransferase|nr:imidazole glycerol phosphate synthase subunit HisH [Syntrophomonadaceae bacterium]
MSTLIVDYGMSNLGSIRRAVQECGAAVVVSDNARDIDTADHIILPGVGAFPDGMRNLCAKGWIEALNKAVAKGIPLLGICLGMQLLSSRGYEEGDTEGLNFIPGEVRRLVSQNKNERLPHVGWNELYVRKRTKFLENIPDGTDFYFVHSYHFVPETKSDILAETYYGDGFVCVLERGNVFGTQFHPEKSGQMGFQILKNFLTIYEV